jgi:hypothetical protein
MKKKYLAFVLALVVMVGVGVAYTQNMGNLQGKFTMVKATPYGTWTLDPSSPSGTRSVSRDDEILVFNVKAGSTTDVNFTEGANIDLSFIASDPTRGDIDGSVDGTEVLLRNSMGYEIGKGYIIPYSGDLAYASIYFTSSVGVSAGATGTYSLHTDTSTLLSEDAGEDDSLTISLSYGKVNPVSLTSNTLTY